MKTLLDLQADPNAHAADGFAPLHAAAVSGNKTAVRELALAKGVDMELRVVVESDSGHAVGLTAFLLACDAGEMDAAAAIAAASPLCGHACTDRLESGSHLLARCSTVRGESADVIISSFCLRSFGGFAITRPQRNSSAKAWHLFL
jgi:ankyrin repeat protein